MLANLLKAAKFHYIKKFKFSPKADKYKRSENKKCLHYLI